MLISRRRFNGYLFGVLGGVVTASIVTPTFADLVEGNDWRRIDPPQPSDTSEKIEVIEFFAYGCPHCSDLNSFITPWSQKLPADVAFRRVPVTFGHAAWGSLAQLYYALESMGELGRLDQAVFDALHKQHVSLFTKSAIMDWVGEHGVDAQAFAAVFDSFDVQTKLNRSNYLVSHYQIEAVPTIAIAGRYVVLGRAAKGFPELLVIADELIAKARHDNG